MLLPPCPLAAERNGMQLLHEHLHLPLKSSANHDRDAIFVAIDFENPGAIQQSILGVGSQLGVAILDTRCLGKPRNVIKTYNFIIGPASYQQKATDKFLFGKSSILTSYQDMASSLESLISPRKRDIILIGHAIEPELRTLHHLGFDLRTSIVGALDTARIASEIQFPYTSTPALCSLLTALQCPFDKLHSAGNDAHFTMRALLSLAVKSYESNCVAALEPEEWKKLLFLKLVAYARLPPAPLTLSERKRQSKIQRRKNVGEKRKKAREPETRLRLRAERAARREEALENKLEEVAMSFFYMTLATNSEPISSGHQPGEPSTRASTGPPILSPEPLVKEEATVPTAGQPSLQKDTESATKAEPATKADSPIKADSVIKAEPVIKAKPGIKTDSPTVIFAELPPRQCPGDMIDSLDNPNAKKKAHRGKRGGVKHKKRTKRTKRQSSIPVSR